jgi:acetyl esterase/lipase
VVFDAPEHFCVYKSGRIDRFHRPVLVAAGVDDANGVASRDVVLDVGTGLSVRLFLPKIQKHPENKLPVLVYFHGGGFIIESAVSGTYHNYVASIAAAAGVLAVSIDYRLAPEHPIPAAYDDCWAALEWAASAQNEWSGSRSTATWRASSSPATARAATSCQ